MSNKIDLNNKDIQMAIVLKLHELQRNNLKYVTYENIEDILSNFIWKKKIPSSLHIAVNDILSITAEKLVQYMSNKAIIEGYKRPLSDFVDLMGGKINEEEKL